MKAGLFRKKILPITLSVMMVLSTGFTAYADDSVPETVESQTEDVPEENETLPEAEEVKESEETTDTDSVTEEENTVAEEESKDETEITSGEEEAQDDASVDPVTYVAHIDETVENGFLLMATDGQLQKEDLQNLEEGTTVYVAVKPDKDYELNMLKVLDSEENDIQTEAVSEGISYLTELNTKTDSLYAFTMPASDVTITAQFKETEKVLDTQAEKIEEEAKFASSQVETIPIAMIGFQSYELAGYGTGYDAAFAPAAGYYDGNANAYCLNPAVQAPGRDSINTTVTYTTTTTAYSDPILLKILYYGFGGAGDISGQITSEAPSRHILTHMALVRRASELGIPGAGDYTYGANSTAIALANRLYDLCASQPAVNGNAKVLTPVSGQQTIVILAEISRKGNLTLTKTSADASMTEGNDCYSLNGAVYEVYSDSGCTKKVGSFTTNSEGKATESLSLDPGTYYVKEITAPKGYTLDETVYNATVTSGNTATVNVSDKPKNDPVRLLLEKVDAKTGKATARLEGAEFTVNYYAGLETTDTPDKTWILKTDKSGSIMLDADHKVSGDDFFTGATGATVLPLGIITIQETKAPEGYIINDTIYTCVTVEKNGTIVTENLPIGENAVKEQPLTPELKTVATSKTTGTHMAVSAKKEVIVDKVSYTNLIPGEKYDIQSSLVSVDTGDFITICSEPFVPEKSSGTISVELKADTTKLEGKVLVVYESLYKERELIVEHCDKTETEQQVSVPKVGTQASDGQTGTNTGVTGKTTIIDKVSYTNLNVGKTYTVKGTLMNKETGEALTIEGATAETTFTAEKSNGMVELIYTIDASALKGTSVVVFEDLYQDNIKVISHNNLSDKKQTIGYPLVHTSAKDSNTDSREGMAVPTKIIDTVAYSNLTPGKTYTVKGTLMNQKTGEALTIEGSASEVTFTPEKAEGTVEVVFTIDAYSLKGVVTVVFEKLYENDIEITSHEDIFDKDQAIEYKNPEIKTTAKDGQTGDQVGTVGTTTIVDTVSYKNLIKGKEYKVKGTLHDQETGEALTIEGATAETTFTAEKSSGTVELVYTIDSSALKGKSVVVFEDLYYLNKKVISHSNIDDKDQTVYYGEIKTTAKDGNTGEQEGFPVETTIIDTVSYTNLVPGKEYSLTGILMNKETGEALSVEGSTAEVTFTPEESTGTIDVEFTFDASVLKGTETVVFEKLYHNDREVIAHTEISDKGQTVKYKEPEIKTTAKDGQTGTHTGTVGKTTIVDKVLYSGLIVGKEYRVSGVLMNKETGEELIVDGANVQAETTFTAESSEGSVELIYELDASALAGVTVVVFEDLYQDNIKLISHNTITDEEQSIHYLKVRTSASVNGAKEVTASSSTKLIDTVTYSNLVVGETYTVTGVLMDKATGKELISNGKTVTGTATFTAESTDGTVEVEFTFDSSSLGGTSTVVFEKLFCNNVEVARHENLNDVDQTVVLKTPPNTPKVPNTGDSTNTVPYAVGLAIAMLFAGVLLLVRRKSKR